VANSPQDSDLNGQRIDALDFELPGQPSTSSAQNETSFSTTATATPAGPWWHSQFNLMLAVFGLLLLAAFMFIVLSPAPDAQRFSTIVTADGSEAESQAVINEDAGEDSATPFDESRNQKARGDSQDVLSELLRVKGELESQGVELWAESEFQAAITTAEEGDQFYSRQDFVAAQNSYQSALQSMQSLNQRLPSVIDGLVSEGQAAISEGKADLAQAAFAKVLKIDANNISALLGVERAKTLDQALEILRNAADDELAFKESDDVNLLAAADEKYKQVLAIDSQLSAATEGSRRVAGLREDKQYRDAMTAGFNSLFAKSYANAKKSFSAALKLRSNDETALAAYRQSLASDSRSSLSSLLSSAKRFEQQEEWSSALGSYQTVLQRDPNQVSAKVGQVRTQVRLDLDQTINSLLSDPLAVAKDTVRKEVESALADAKALANKGPIIKSQIQALESSLKNADAEVKVEFLKPGRYVLSGSRLGYRDVRLNIELRANGQALQNFHLACNESVAKSSKPNLIDHGNQKLVKLDLVEL